MFEKINPAVAVVILNALIARATNTGDNFLTRAIMEAVIGALSVPPANGSPVPDTGELTRIEMRAVCEGKKIQAIKLVRERTGLGLREAKDLVDKWQDDVNPATRPYTS